MSIRDDLSRFERGGMDCHLPFGAVTRFFNAKTKETHGNPTFLQKKLHAVTKF